MTCVIVDEQGQRHHIKKVGYGQVEHVDVVFGQIGPLPPYLQDDCSVEWQAEQEDKSVHGRKQNTFEVFLIGATKEGYPTAAAAADVTDVCGAGDEAVHCVGLCGVQAGGEEAQGEASGHKRFSGGRK